jgi:RNA polymerase sigma-70 factor (ECF subfamily)
MTEDLRTDEALVLAYARDGDEAALGALVERHWARAWRMALRSLGDPAQAEDAAQEAMVALARGARSFAPGASFMPWFRAIVLNAVRMAGRGRGRRARHEAAAAGRASEAAPDETGARRVAAEEVLDRLSALPHDHRSAIVLHYLEGLTHDEVAASLGCPRGTVATWIRRGVERLREAMGATASIAAVTAALEAAAAAPASAAEPVPLTPLASALAQRARRPAAGIGGAKAAGVAALAVGAIAAWIVVSGAGGDAAKTPEARTSALPEGAVAALPSAAPVAERPAPAASPHASGPSGALPEAVPTAAPPASPGSSPRAATAAAPGEAIAPETDAAPDAVPLAVEGRIVSEIGRRPIAGVTVALLVGHERLSSDRDAIAIATTDLAGGFHIPATRALRRSAGGALVDARGRRVEEATIRVERRLPRLTRSSFLGLEEKIARGEALELQLETDAAEVGEVVLSGSVLAAEDGRAIPGARVLFELARADGKGLSSVELRARDDGTFEQRAFTATADGRLADKEGAPFETIRIAAQAPGREPYEAQLAHERALGGGPIEIALPRGGATLELTLLDRWTSAPLAGASLFAGSPEHGERLWEYDVDTDAGGTARLSGLPRAARLRIRGELPDGRRVDATLETPADATPARMTLEVEPLAAPPARR